MFLLLALLNAVRLVVVFYTAPVLPSQDLAVPLAWLGALYGGWTLVFAVGAVLCWLRKGRCPAFPAAVLYQATLWLVRAVSYRTTYAGSLWPWHGALTVAFLVTVIVLAKKPQ